MKIEQVFIKETKIQEQLEKAVSLFKKGNLDESTAEMNEVLKSNPENLEAKGYIERANTIKQVMNTLPKSKPTQTTKTTTAPKTEDKKFLMILKY